jgi:hypothetical protein
MTITEVLLQENNIHSSVVLYSLVPTNIFKLYSLVLKLTNITLYSSVRYGNRAFSFFSPPRVLHFIHPPTPASPHSVASSLLVPPLTCCHRRAARLPLPLHRTVAAASVLLTYRRGHIAALSTGHCRTAAEGYFLYYLLFLIILFSK